ncbi:hypothetical protein PtA15_14A306 [Puccinia triticina]|uniref:Dihydroorotate dehydrogenase (quinone), mitochondrial n=1 Tax=Puccinia triticina TaxID=208348 RepID=A0ABY7D940_9BASI|nr:uncharacterized protein PtA15_14A306 [Puccinia triticina]WAQ91422.1 hypothetical protein PtA15_14A306 [Puccinia triticina]
MVVTRNLNMNHLRPAALSLLSASTRTTAAGRGLRLPARLPISREPASRTLFTSAGTVTRTTLPTRLINFSKVLVLIGSVIGSYAYLTDTRATIHSWLTVPIIKLITNDDPEEAHHLAIRILKLLSKIHLIRDVPQPNDELLSFELWGKKFNNPIGMAAGFDKDGDAVDGLFDIGFGYVEIGSITPEAQPGNPRPRMFRIPSTESIVNRYGFNSQGHLAVLAKLRHRLLSYLDQHRHLGYSTLLSRYDNMNPVQTAYADSGFTHLVVPTSSSSAETQTGSLDQALGEIADEIELPRSLRVGQVLGINLGKNKHSPAESAKVDGIIISNTTTSRPAGSGSEPEIKETGGLSGPPLKPLALKALSIVYAATEGTIPLVGCGGIRAAEDVLEYGRAGASFVQLYSALTFQGIGLPRKLKDGLGELLRTQEDGKQWSQIVGSHARNLDLQKLIAEELKQVKTASYDDQINEIKQTIQFVDQSIAAIEAQHSPPTLNPPQKAQKEQPLLAAAAISNSSPPPPKSAPSPPHQVGPERGILAHWKRTRQAQIDNNDFKRVV